MKAMQDITCGTYILAYLHITDNTAMTGYWVIYEQIQCAVYCFNRQLQMLLLPIYRSHALQVFCSKVSPNCGACPLQSSCEYALGNGKKFQPQAASPRPAEQKVSCCQSLIHSCHKQSQAFS